MESPTYNYAIVRSFVTWSVVWGTGCGSGRSHRLLADGRSGS